MPYWKWAASPCAWHTLWWHSFLECAYHEQAWFLWPSLQYEHSGWEISEALIEHTALSIQIGLWRLPGEMGLNHPTELSKGVLQLPLNWLQLNQSVAAQAEKSSQQSKVLCTHSNTPQHYWWSALMVVCLQPNETEGWEKQTWRISVMHNSSVYTERHWTHLNQIYIWEINKKTNKLLLSQRSVVYNDIW